MSDHRCPSPGCDTRVPSSQFACRPHWFSLPKTLRDAIWDAYRDEPLGEAHLTAMENATEYLRAKAAA